MFRGRGGRKRKEASQSVRPRQMQSSVDASFRRNTAVVSKSQREKAAQIRSTTERQQLHKQQKAKQRFRRRLTILGVLVAGVLCGFMLRITGVEIHSNASSKLSNTELRAYQDMVQDEITQHSFLRQSWSLDTRALTEALERQLPEAAHIVVEKKSTPRPMVAVTIRFRTPVFTWLDGQGVRQYVDENGVLFAKNLDPNIQDESLITIEDQSGVVLAAGDTVLTKEIVAFIGQLYAKLPPLYRQGEKVEKLIIPTTTREVQVQMSNHPYTIRLSSVRPIDEQMKELHLLLQHLESSGVEPTATIDVRVPHKAFYK